MPFNGSGVSGKVLSLRALKFAASNAVAFLTGARAVSSDNRILRREFVPMLTMGGRSPCSQHNCSGFLDIGRQILGRHNLFNRLAGMISAPKSLVRNASSLRPLGQIKRFALKRYAHILADVVRLFLWRCPAAITWFIIPVRINALDGHSGRSEPHVNQEQLKICPPRAAFDATTAIVRKFLDLGIIAARPHTYPNSVGRCAAFSVFDRSHMQTLTSLGRMSIAL